VIECRRYAVWCLAMRTSAECLQDFYQRFEQEALVIDSWFAVQATNPQATIE
jgi:aminopeptidase N